MDDKVLIFDTTLRDGEQSAGTAMTVDEKLEIARHLERLGVDVIEAGFPVSSQGDFEAVQQIAREIRGPIIAALSHANDKAIDRAAEALEDAAHPRIHVFPFQLRRPHQPAAAQEPGRGGGDGRPEHSQGAQSRGRRGVLSHGLQPHRPGVPGPYRGGRGRGRSHHHQHS